MKNLNPVSVRMVYSLEGITLSWSFELRSFWFWKKSYEYARKVAREDIHDIRAFQDIKSLGSKFDTPLGSVYVAPLQLGDLPGQEQWPTLRMMDTKGNIIDILLDVSHDLTFVFPEDNILLAVFVDDGIVLWEEVENDS